MIEPRRNLPFIHLRDAILPTPYRQRFMLRKQPHLADWDEGLARPTEERHEQSIGSEANHVAMKQKDVTTRAPGHNQSARLLSLATEARAL